MNSRRFSTGSFHFGRNEDMESSKDSHSMPKGQDSLDADGLDQDLLRLVEPKRKSVTPRKFSFLEFGLDYVY